MSRISIGIDIGMSGGLAILKDGKIHSLHKMPTFEVNTGKKITKGKKKGQDKMENHIDAPALHDILCPYFDGMPRHATPNVFVETVTHLFNLPSSSNFKLGYAAGVVHGVLQTLGEFYLIKPSQWQKIFRPDDIVQETIKGIPQETASGKPKKDTKKTAMACAKRLYPEYDFKALGGVTQIDGMVDALLIATHGESL